MDNKGVLLAGSLGAIGALLAYYGYNNINVDDEGSDKNIDTTTKKNDVASTTELRELVEVKKLKENEEEKIQQNVKLAIKELKEKVSEDKSNENITKQNVEAPDANPSTISEIPSLTDQEKWRKYWKDEFAKSGNTNSATSEYN